MQQWLELGADSDEGEVLCLPRWHSELQVPCSALLSKTLCSRLADVAFGEPRPGLRPNSAHLMCKGDIPCVHGNRYGQYGLLCSRCVRRAGLRALNQPATWLLPPTVARFPSRPARKKRARNF